MELGRLPIMTFAKKNFLLNWSRIFHEKQANSLVLSSFVHSKIYSLKSSESVKSSFDSLGIGLENSLTSILVMRKMSEKFHQETFTEINSDKSKLRTYAKLKETQGFEE